jgi:preprotein translocase subunit SecB
MADLAVKARTDFDPETESTAETDEFTVKVEMQPPKEASQGIWQVTLILLQQPTAKANFPYEFRLELVGFFRCSVEGIEPETEERMVRINGASMLYGIAREIVRANTERGPWSGVMLPTISFYEPPPETSETKAVDRGEG